MFFQLKNENPTETPSLGEGLEDESPQKWEHAVRCQTAVVPAQEDHDSEGDGAAFRVMQLIIEGCYFDLLRS